MVNKLSDKIVNIITPVTGFPEEINRLVTDYLLGDPGDIVDTIYYNNAVGIAVDEKYIYVSRKHPDNKIYIYDKVTYDLVHFFGLVQYLRDPYGDLWEPTQIVADDKYFYVSDSRSRRVCVFKKQFGKNRNLFVRTIKKIGLNRPFFICVDNTSLYVADVITDSVFVFYKSTGKFRNKIAATKTCDIALIGGLAIDNEFIYVVENYGKYIEIFNKITHAKVRDIKYDDKINVLNIFVERNYIYLMNSRTECVTVIKKEDGVCFKKWKHKENLLPTNFAVDKKHMYIIAIGKINIHVRV